MKLLSSSAAGLLKAYLVFDALVLNSRQRKLMRYKDTAHKAKQKVQE